MISLRVWLDRFPSQVRFCVALLAMLSLVAPTWHVCSMGGHVMSHSGDVTTMAGMKHFDFQKSKSGTLICFCAATHPEKPASPFHLNGRMVMEHDANCLALMLSAMPALLVSPAQLQVVSRVSFRVFSSRCEFPDREFIRTFCGRGPPVML